MRVANEPAAWILAPFGILRITRRVCLRCASLCARSPSSPVDVAAEEGWFRPVRGRSASPDADGPALEASVEQREGLPLVITHAGHHQLVRASACVRLSRTHVRCQWWLQELHWIRRFRMLVVPQRGQAAGGSPSVVSRLCCWSLVGNSHRSVLAVAHLSVVGSYPATEQFESSAELIFIGSMLTEKFECEFEHANLSHWNHLGESAKLLFSTSLLAMMDQRQHVSTKSSLMMDKVIQVCAVFTSSRYSQTSDYSGFVTSLH